MPMSLNKIKKDGAFLMTLTSTSKSIYSKLENENACCGKDNAVPHISKKNNFVPNESHLFNPFNVKLSINFPLYI